MFAERNAACGAICCFDDAEMCDDGDPFARVAGCDMFDRIQGAVMELAWTFGFTFAVRKEMIGIGGIPCRVGLRVCFPDFFISHALAGTVTAFAEHFVGQDRQMVCASDFMRSLIGTLQVAGKNRIQRFIAQDFGECNGLQPAFFIERNIAVSLQAFELVPGRLPVPDDEDIGRLAHLRSQSVEATAGFRE